MEAALILGKSSTALSEQHYHIINRNPGTLVVKERILNSVMVCNTGHDTTCSTIFHYLLPFAPIKEMNTYDREKT
jgi:hypothetical protein